VLTNGMNGENCFAIILNQSAKAGYSIRCIKD